MSEFQVFPAALFDQAGLNRQHVFAIDALPEAVRSTLGDTEYFSQLILLGHGGKRLWACVQASGMAGEHPIDDYVVQTVTQIFAAEFPDRRYRIAYPGDGPIGLQQLGKLAGWHNPSPFMVGIDQEWGSWFAYRAVVLADTDFSPFFAVDRSPQELALGRGNPCLNCIEQPCISACPVGAVSNEAFALDKCIDYRRLAGSACEFTCLARVACPVGSEHRYSAAQLRHTYGISLRMIRQLYD